MSLYDERRNIAAVDRYVVNLVQESGVSDCVGTPFVMPGDGETAFVVLPLTGLEISRLLSCVMYGAELLYPGVSHDVYYSFARGLECSMLCDAIVSECLADPSFVEQVIAALGSAGALQGTAGSDFPTQTNLNQVLVDLGDCDEADRFGACYKVVELLDIVTTDLLDVLAVYEANVDIAVELAKKIPIIGQYAATPLQVAAYMIGYVIDLYAAAYDTATHDELACAIYCVMGDSCVLTMQNVLEGYRTALTVEVTPPSILNTPWTYVAQWFYELAGEYSDTVLAGLMHWLILQVFSRGSSFNASTARILEIALSSWTPVSVPESCECDYWTQIFDFTSESGSEPNTIYGNGGWVSRDKNTGVGPTYGATYTSGVGWQNSGTGLQQGFGIDFELLNDATFATLQIYATGTLPDPAFYGGNEDQSDFSTNWYHYGGAASGDTYACYGLTDVVDYPSFGCGVLDFGSHVAHTVTKITITGLGTNPFTS